ncbi:MFS transporter [Leucobacter weissii]|uniref:MFS transporter n=1 Tax=Leucobacter weissii TaxID=1983706 RepID=A0A939S9Z0_9MICO|nr:MFS transporter [Leucobacter weissii]MBO1901407.1 MFS transporter [Leucobacter weissii]
MAGRRSPEQQRVRQWIGATIVVFTALGFSFGSWLSRLPAVRDRLDASTFEMSLYGLCLALGSLTGLVFSGRIVTRLGPKRTLALGMSLQGLLLPGALLLLWAGPVGGGVAVLFAYGLAFSVSDVAINVSGAEAERALGRPRMPLFHGAYSFGSVAALGVGSAAEAAAVPAPLHIGIALLLVAVCSLWALRRIPGGRGGGSVPVGEGGEPAAAGGAVSVLTGPIPQIASPRPAPAARPYNPWRDPRIYLVGLVAMSMSLAEGSGADWIPLALVDGRGFDNSSATLTVSAFFVAMLLVRLSGSALLMRFGRVAAIRGSALICATGVLVVILVPAPWAAVLGAMLWGAGCALGFPVGISAAADDPSTAVRSVAAVSAIAYGAYLLGPMIIGFLGEHLGLLRAFWPLVAFMALCVAIAGALRPPAEASATDSGPR